MALDPGWGKTSRRALSPVMQTVFSAVTSDLIGTLLSIDSDDPQATLGHLRGQRFDLGQATIGDRAIDRYIDHGEAFLTHALGDPVLGAIKVGPLQSGPAASGSLKSRGATRLHSCHRDPDQDPDGPNREHTPPLQDGRP
jgi:hypothetical protein